MLLKIQHYVRYAFTTLGHSCFFSSHREMRFLILSRLGGLKKKLQKVSEYPGIIALERGNDETWTQNWYGGNVG